MKNKISPKLSVIIPIYNEASNLTSMITRLEKTFKQARLSYELIFVDDNSNDRTQTIFKKIRKNKIILLKKQGKQGKAYSLLEGFEKARGSIITMIDGDLQYPPEAIPQMIKKLKKADIIVANRKLYKDSLSRRILSKTFRTVFGRKFFGLDHDVQSGLKVFKRKVIDDVKFYPSSPWTFDLEFLHRARQAGFSIDNFDITFAKRLKGDSKIDVVKTTFDIGASALRLKAKKIHPVHIKPRSKKKMLGAGIGYKTNRYITHTTMPHALSALTTFTAAQKLIIFLFALNTLIGIYINPLLTLQIVVGALTFIYFADVLFNFYLVRNSLNAKSEITFKKNELDALDEKKLPMYTILCPLYREAHIIPSFLKAIGKISWPKNKLDVLLLLEADDKESINSVKKMNLPSYVRVIVVPHSMPKTKPKACNYGLAFAKGEYLVIYDAEDIPDPMQLKKAYVGFKKVSSDTICLQAKLNYYNPSQNLLTRFFTAEYSLWFDVTLTGLQSLNTTLPLGGTSNHFKIQSLHEVEGWDPFNVTEDADLGVRLFKKGYKTAIIDSTTLEEANSRWGNWLRQRSRWIKGYMQTYLVHTRGIHESKKQGIHDLIFQLVIGGKIAFVLINPFLWISTISYFALYQYVGPQIEALYPTGIFYMAVFSLVFGNFLFLIYYMLAVAKKEQWSLMKFTLLVPFYWLMISIAAFIALKQLILKPHYWEKTLHGLHLVQPVPAKQVVIAPSPTHVPAKKRIPNFGPLPIPATFMVIHKIQRNIFSFILAPLTYIGNFETKILPYATNLPLKKLTRRISKTHFSAMILIAGLGISNVFHFLYSAYLGRTLQLEDFALVGLISGLFSFVIIAADSIGTTIENKTSFLIGKKDVGSAYSFWKHVRARIFIISVVITLAWLISSTFWQHFFNIESVLPILIFAPVLLISLAYAADRSFLSARLSFIALSALLIFESALKFLLSIFFVQIGLATYAYAAMPISILFAFVLGWVWANKGRAPQAKLNSGNLSFPKKFFIASLLSGLSTVFFINTDVILAKHLLSPENAGLYILASLIGKTVFFLAVFASPFIMPLVSRSEGAERDSGKVLSLTLLGTFALGLIPFIIFGIFGEYTAPFLFGENAISAIPYLLPLTLALLCFSLARVFSEYYLAKKYYTFAALAFLLGLTQIGAIYTYGNSVSSIVYITTSIWTFYFFATLALHLTIRYVKESENFIANIINSFTISISNRPQYQTGLRVLIFNWRDTKHKWAGGAEVYIHQLAKRLVNEGNSVTVFCGNSVKRPHTEILDGVQIYRRGGFYTVYLWAFIYYMLKFRGKYDVIIDSENGIPFFTPLFAKEKIFLLIHHVHQEVFRKSLKWPLAQIALFLEAKLMPFVYRNIQVITVSPSSKEAILKHNLTKSDPIIIYNGVDLKGLQPVKKDEQKPLILYVGRLQYYKSLNVFVVAAQRILKKYPNAEFVIAGEGEQKEKLKKYAKYIGIEDHVKFVGYVSEEEKVKLMQKAWVFVNPSFMEGWGITTMEAAACGTPTVASDVPGLRDSIRNGETGFLVKYRDYSGFTKSILKIIEDKKVRKTMSNKAIRWAQGFSWETSAKTMLQLISNYTKKETVLTPNKYTYLINRITSLF